MFHFIFCHHFSLKMPKTWIRLTCLCVNAIFPFIWKFYIFSCFHLLSKNHLNAHWSLIMLQFYVFEGFFICWEDFRESCLECFESLSTFIGSPRHLFSCVLATKKLIWKQRSDEEKDFFFNKCDACSSSFFLTGFKKIISFALSSSKQSSWCNHFSFFFFVSFTNNSFYSSN